MAADVAEDPQQHGQRGIEVGVDHGGEGSRIDAVVVVAANGVAVAEGGGQGGLAEVVGAGGPGGIVHVDGQAGVRAERADRLALEVHGVGVGVERHLGPVVGSAQAVAAAGLCGRGGAGDDDVERADADAGSRMLVVSHQLRHGCGDAAGGIAAGGVIVVAGAGAFVALVPAAGDQGGDPQVGDGGGEPAAMGISSAAWSRCCHRPCLRLGFARLACCLWGSRAA